MDRVACCFADELLAPADIWDVLEGDALEVEFRDSEERPRVEIHPGQTDWKEPSSRVRRAINIGQKTYWQINIFLLDRPDAIPQPREE